MIRPSNRIFWLLLVFVGAALAVLIVRPLRQWFGAAVWDAVLVPFYAASPLLMGGRGLLCGAVVLLLLVTPFLLSPLWEALGILDSAAMTLARSYYNSRFVRYGLERDTGKDRDVYARLRALMLWIGYPLRGVKRIPILSDLYTLLFNDVPSVRVALLLINRIHEASYFAAQQEDPLKMRERWHVSTTAAQALAAHVLAGPARDLETRLIAALLYDDLHSQSYVLSAHTRLILPRRVPVWRERALALYHALSAELPAESPWAAWIGLRLLWLEGFSGTTLDWGRLSIIEEQFWRLTELAEDESGYGIAIAAAQRFATDLVALIALRGGPSAPDLLRFAADLGHWIDLTADGLHATVWHNAPSSRASELPPATFLAGQLIPEIGPKWAEPGEAPSDALRAQLIAARGAIYTLIQGGWQGIVLESELEHARTLTQRAAEEVAIDDEFGGHA